MSEQAEEQAKFVGRFKISPNLESSIQIAPVAINSFVEKAQAPKTIPRIPQVPVRTPVKPAPPSDNSSDWSKF